MPLVVLGGSSPGPTRGLGGFQESDQLAFARPACKWIQQVDSSERIAELVHLALGKSISGRPGGVYLDFPGHLVGRKIPEERMGLRASQPQIFAPHPDPVALDRVADMLAAAERPLIMLGKGAAWSDAGDELERLVNHGIPYVTSPMGRVVVPDDNAQFVNGARSAALAAADVIVMLGGRFNWIFQFGKTPRYAQGVRIAQVDLCAEEMYSGAEVEIAETFWGRKRGERMRRGYMHKEKILTLVERGGELRSFHVPEVSAKTLRPILRLHISQSAHVKTDEAGYHQKLRQPSSMACRRADSAFSFSPCSA